ncbi:XRE family transcriptional regulator [Staphylococcus haemolyticus]|uniref:helix-turn-helix domain-containing protein n=1 Tax=Staphylococcus haemolyticus TaxID=1283 RepID=UPI000E69345E|nr:helix-turn-helix domain-containing protein [Staphylococcus haemolyticus]MCE4987168.1 helix-turn-helix transcriptional regulator [Staphylococcus haemolyticus]MCE5049678.1 helix-turn-helix transcriptional regulator [Staphylococcus haemolyticus]RIO64156.1 XRE family transcriptional regulator [Staphylococcus haemolyticus]
MDIVQKIRFLCQQQGITVAELERRIGLSNGQITKWRRQVPGINKVQLVADYFDVSVDYLLGREKDEYAGEDKSEDILIMHRATENMTEAQRQKALTILETMFDDWDDLTK